ncbi:TetR family transcriptional regulator [Comamonas endophytica]|uniref:TetR family transcriptional regulator n=1 Tax=Comamonas endophytica TaxID=2949090 RepID=UPI0036188DAC
MARRTKEDAVATRNALLDAAEQVFLAQGVSQSSLAAIAQQAGATRGAVYWHFKDKLDLFTAMIDRVTMPLDQVVFEGAGQLSGLRRCRACAA